MRPEGAVVSSVIGRVRVLRRISDFCYRRSCIQFTKNLTFKRPCIADHRGRSVAVKNVKHNGHGNGEDISTSFPAMRPVHRWQR